MFLILTTTLLFCSTTVRAQFEQLKIHVLLKNGDDSSFFIDSIAKMTYRVETASPVHAFQRMSVTPKPVGVFDDPTDNIDLIDSIRFLALHYDFTDTLFFEYFSSTYRRRYLLEPNTIDHFDGYTVLNNITFGLDTVDTGVIELPNEYKIPPRSYSQTAFFRSVLWSGNRIYCAPPIRVFTLDSARIVLKDSIIDKEKDSIWWAEWSLALNARQDRLLGISSHYNDVSAGWLVELDLLKNGEHRIIDSGLFNSSALYIPRTDSIIYYSYGNYSDSNRKPANAGYNIRDPAGNKSLILHYISSLGLDEVMNGFDVTPDGKKLLLGSTAQERPPLLIEYDLQAHSFDTLFKFSSPARRPNLWVRYSHDAKRVLYCNFGLDPFYGPTDTSEVGIITLSDRSKRVLTVCEGTNCKNRIYLFPQWSPDDSTIVYLTTQVATEPPGAVGAYWLEILKKLR